MKSIKLIIAFLLVQIQLNAQENKYLSLKTDSRYHSSWQNEPINKSRYPILPNSPTDQEYKKHNEELAKLYETEEQYRRVLRDWGTNLWEKKTDDIQRFVWLRKTVVLSPIYARNLSDIGLAKRNKRYIIPLDSIAKNNWDEKYQRFRKEYMNSNQLADKEKRALIEAELSFGTNFKWRESANEHLNLRKWIEKATEYVLLYKASESVIKNLLRHANFIFYHSKEYGLNDDDLDDFIEMFKNTDIPAYLEFALQKATLMALKSKPLQFCENDIHGSKIDLKNYKGKLVLIDFWSLGCPSCIEMMPEIKRVYEKYRIKGFEVISACFVLGDWDRDNGVEIYKDEKQKIIAIHDKIGAAWPLTLLERKPGEKRHRIWSTYGFSGVPQLLLIDEEGKLIHYNGEMSRIERPSQGIPKSGLEKLVQEHLKKKS